MAVKKGNISIFVIFVLLASSMLWLLTLLFVQKLLRYQSVAVGYYQSYYTAKAWLELALSLHAQRGIGFSTTIPSEIIAENFDCGQDCVLQSSLLARSSFVQDAYWNQTSCTSGFTLQPWQSRAVPLFYDNGTGTLYNIFTSPMTYTSLIGSRRQLDLQNVQFGGLVDDIIIGMFVLSGTSLVPDGSFLQQYSNTNIVTILPQFRDSYDDYVQLTLSQSSQDLLDQTLQHYLLIANAGTSTEQLCLTMDAWLYNADTMLWQEQSIMRSLGVFAGYRVGLQAVLNTAIPQYLLQTYTNL